MSSRTKNDREKGNGERELDDEFALLEEEEARLKQLARNRETEQEMQDQQWEQAIASAAQADFDDFDKTTVTKPETVNEPESLRVDVTHDAHQNDDAPPSKPTPGGAYDVLSDLVRIDERQSSNPAVVRDGNAMVLAEKASMLRGKQLRNSRSNDEDTVVRRSLPRSQDSRSATVLDEKAGILLRGQTVRLRSSRLGKETTEVHQRLVQSKDNTTILSEKANLLRGKLQSSRSDPEIEARRSVHSQDNATLLSAKADMMRGASRRLQNSPSVQEMQVSVQTRQTNSTVLGGKADMFQRKIESSHVQIMREKPDLIRRVHSDSNLQAVPRDENLGLFMVEHDGRVVTNPTIPSVATISTDASPPGAYAAFPNGASPNDADESLTQTAHTGNTGTISGSSRARRSHSLVPIEARMVSDESKELVMARPDSWWRQNQWWLLALLLLVILGVVLAVVFTTINSGSDEPATPAPTTFEEGVQYRAEALIADNGVDIELWSGDSLSPQARALDFVVSRKIEEGDRLADPQLLQQFALATLFYATGGGNETWMDYVGWLQDSDECNWFGVRCDGEAPDDAAITSLDLSMNGLGGTIPPELALLSNSLSSLVLSESHLGGVLPSELGRLSKLTTLDVSDNDLTGSLPESLDGLSILIALNLSQNELDGRIPETIRSLSFLHHMSLANNLLTGEVPSGIGLLTSLEYMDISHNRLSYALPAEIGQLSLLTELRVQNNNLLGPLPTDLALMTHLRHFDMSNNFVFGVIPEALALLHELQSLELGNNLLSGTIPEDILRLRKLSSLRLGGNFLRGTLPTNCCSRLINRRNRFRLRDLGATLEELDLSDNFLEYSSDDGTRELLFPVDFFELSNLVVLNISNADLRGTISTEFGRLTSLRKLDLGQNKLVGTIPSTLGSLSNLEELTLGDGYRIGTDKSWVNDKALAENVGNRLVGSIPSKLYQISSMTSLELALNQLTGTLSTEIGLWTQLESIDLRLNNLSGELPVELFRISSLRRLLCPLNAFDPGPIPSEIGYWSSMTTLHMYRSNRVGTIPNQLSRLTLLEDLRLGHNELNSTFPTAILNITSLRILELPSNMIHGSLPAVGWSSLIELTRIKLDANKLTGTIPADFYAMENVERIDINQNPLAGTLSSLIFGMPRLTRWAASRTQLSGTIPTEIGLSTTLSEILVVRNELTGTIPTELGLLTTLVSSLLDRNNLNGTLPIELGSLPRLRNLQAQENNLVGSIPSEIGQALSLISLGLWKNQLTGSLPSEIGLLPLESLRLENNNLSGALPPQLSSVLSLHTVHLNNNSLTGSFPYELCDAPYIFIDCDLMICACCGCSSRPPSNSPSITGTPTYSPTVTSSPTLSGAPTMAPSFSMLPSSSMVPTVHDACGRFSSLANVNGSRAVNLTQSFREAPASDEGYAIVSLPFVFRWRGIDQYSEILVNTNGAVYPGSDREKLLLCRWNNALCWTASKVVLEGNYEVPRIAAAQEDLDLTNTNGTIYAYSTVDTMIISFEGVGLFDDDVGLDFQVVLEEGGRVELRWGNGSLPEGRQVAAGVEDDIHNVAAPATGGPFNLQGVTAGGRWPGFSCRTFVPINGTYVEWSPLAE